MELKVVNRRKFAKQLMMFGIGVRAGHAQSKSMLGGDNPDSYYEEPSKKIPIRNFDVVAGGGTAMNQRPPY